MVIKTLKLEDCNFQAFVAVTADLAEVTANHLHIRSQRQSAKFEMIQVCFVFPPQPINLHFLSLELIGGVKRQ